MVLEGVDTGAYDRRIAAWLAQLDDSTCRTIASPMWRCRLAGRRLAVLRSPTPTPRGMAGASDEPPEEAGPRRGAGASGRRTSTTVISVLERLAAGLPVTTVALEIVHRSSARANRRDPGNGYTCSSG